MKGALLLVALVLLAPARGFAIAVQVPCDAPSVFSDAALNVVVLPYSQPATLRNADARAGRQLASLVELEAMLSVVKFGSVGLVQLVGDQRCTPEAVLDKLLGRVKGAREQLKPGNALVLVWGRIFESGGALYLQSYLRFLRRGTLEGFSLSLEGRPLIGRLTSQALGCPPRKVTLDDIAAISQQFASATLLRTSPEMGAAFVPIPDDGGPYSFRITEVRGDWVQLEPMADERRLPRGWVRARSDDPQWPLRRRMPEMGLVEGIGGYLAARVATKASPATFDAADAALAQYLERWKDGALLSADDAAGSGMALAVAIPAQLRGFIALMRGTLSTSALAAAGAHFERAAGVAPFSSDARNLAVVARLALAFRQPASGQPASRFVDDLIAAASAQPDNPVVLANLGTVYDLVLAPKAGSPLLSATGAQREDYQRQRDALRRVLPPAAPAR
jgi:hypothetical protein